MDGLWRPRGIDARIAALAERQHGVVARWQLAALGVGRGAIERRLSRGRLHLIHKGVYAVGHRVVSKEGRWMAAVLAAGPDAALSHHSATNSIPVTTVPRTLLDLAAVFLDDAVLPCPKINTRIEGHEVDFGWPEYRLIIELDGYATHGTRHAFERDRRRDRRLQAAGWRVIRITWRQLHREPVTLAAELRRLLRTMA